MQLEKSLTYKLQFCFVLFFCVCNHSIEKLFRFKRRVTLSQ